MLVRYFKENQVEKILKQFHFYKKNYKRDREHQMWEEGAHPQLLKTQNMLLQNLDYIHSNPVKRGYVDRSKDWRYPSARNYVGLEEA